MALRYGFKAESNWWSRKFRSEMELNPEDPLCPWKLAEELGIPIFGVSAFQTLEPQAVLYLFSNAGKKEFSALTFSRGLRRFIIHNDAHDKKRQASNIAHELAHAVLQHPVPKMMDANGSRNHNRDHEDEASWLGPALLISDEAALHIAGSGMTTQEASDYYRVSREIIQMRVNVSGARRRVA